MPTTTPRKPKPATLTREEVAEMIAEALAAERARNDQALAGVMMTFGGVAQAMDDLAGAIAEARTTLDLHAGLLGPMAEAFAAGCDLADAGEASTDIPN